MTKSVEKLRQQGFSELACQFARFIHRKESGQHELTVLTAGLLAETLAEGHVCLNLNNLPASSQVIVSLLPASVAEWRSQLLASHSVGEPGDYKPLILTDDNLLYLYRYWLDERDIARQIQQRLHPAKFDAPLLQQALEQWPSQSIDVDWQKVAVVVALTRQFAVISGGPGTGKTTIILQILTQLQAQQADLKIGLAAPTGKAAARLQQSLGSANQTEVKTLHRLLGITEQNDQGRYHAGRPLPLEVLIIDEASMIDINLMAKLMRALSAQTRLILLGDSQQLASVESGAVLANLSASEQGHFSATFRQQFPTLNLPITSATSSGLTDSFVRLQHSYRFDVLSVIGQLASLVNGGDAQASLALLERADAIWFDASEMQQRELLLKGYQPFIHSVEEQASPQQILQAFEQFRLLAALKQGPQSVSSVNRLMSRLLALRGWRTTQPFYHGRPIMITQNDYRQRLFNGDTGMILFDEQGVLRACFCFDDEIRWVPINRLPTHETAFAMTVHKSQGSEFDAVCVLLPDELSPILNRELLYTAITRAKSTLTLLSRESSLRHTILTQHIRESGLQQQLHQSDVRGLAR